MLMTSWGSWCLFTMSVLWNSNTPSFEKHLESHFTVNSRFDLYYEILIAIFAVKINKKKISNAILVSEIIIFFISASKFYCSALLSALIVNVAITEMQKCVYLSVCSKEYYSVYRFSIPKRWFDELDDFIFRKSFLIFFVKCYLIYFWANNKQILKIDFSNFFFFLFFFSFILFRSMKLIFK